MLESENSPNHIIKAGMSIAPFLIGLGYIYINPNISLPQAALLLGTEGVVSSIFLIYQLRQYQIKSHKLGQRIMRSFTKLDISQLEKPTNVSEGRWGHATIVLVMLEENASLIESGGGNKSIVIRLLSRIRDEISRGILPREAINVIMGIFRRHNLDPKDFGDLAGYEEDPDQKPGGWSE